MEGVGKTSAAGRLAPDVNRILYIRNLPFKISSEELYDLFGRYGRIFQIRIGTDKETRGSAYVVYEDIYEARNACEALSGFNVLGRYLIVLYYQASRSKISGGGSGASGSGGNVSAAALRAKKEELERLKEKYGVTGSS